MPAFLDLLCGLKMTLVVDVRSQPISRYVPHFNKKSLCQEVERAAMRYLFLGDKLGGRPKDAPRLPNGRIDDEKIRQGAVFREGMKKLLDEARYQRACLVCSEEDPAACHRYHLIAEDLGILGIFVRHIRKDGTLETAAEIESRLRTVKHQLELW